MTTMRSMPAFLAVAAAVTLTPGPAFALLVQVAATHGRRAALANIAGNSLGVLVWGVLSALGVSALIAADELAYDVLRLAGAAFLVFLGLRTVLATRSQARPFAAAGDVLLARADSVRTATQAARKGLLNSLANPKLAVFFVALFPQFLTPGTAVLPAALAMASVIVVLDVAWYGMVALLVDRFRRAVAPRLLRRIERVTGAVLVAFGLRLAVEAR